MSIYQIQDELIEVYNLVRGVHLIASSLGLLASGIEADERPADMVADSIQLMYMQLNDTAGEMTEKLDAILNVDYNN